MRVNFLHQSSGGAVAELAATARDRRPTEEEERFNCAVKALVEATTISGPGVVGIGPLASRVIMEPMHLQSASEASPSDFSLRCGPPGGRAVSRMADNRVSY